MKSGVYHTKMSETLSNQSSHRERRRKRVFTVLFLITLVGLGYGLWWFLKQPVQGTIRAAVGGESTPQKKMSEKWLYQGKYITFSYEGSYEERSHQVFERPPVLESVLLTASSLDGRKIAVTVANRGTDDLESDPSYQMRMSDQATYEQSSFKTSSFQGEMFTQSEAPFEKTAFFTTRGLIVSVSLSSLFRVEGTAEEMEALLSDFHLSR